MMESKLIAPPYANGKVFDEEQVPLYYSRKTADILHKYGPGPRVHFHMGLFDPHHTPNTTVSQRVLKRRIVASQEAILDHSARTWGVHAAPPRRLLDIGCGVGGGSLYWAQEHGAEVTGLTVAAEHIPVIKDFARQAGVGDRVTPLVGDIHQWNERRLYDAAYANESSGYMDRERLFEVVANALKPGGWFGIQEHFICRPEWTDFIDDYYKTRLGTLPEYIRAAAAAGLELEQDEDVTDRVAEFWIQSMAWNTAELDRVEASGVPPVWTRERLTESTVTHGKLFRIWRDHAVETRLLLFRLAGS
ncbi:methyltransferase domain-containing protein [Streptomyces sp. SL13]|jgi:tocopherol O-methyltransferase|uniref:Methyltransferase domain-containing protein n=1 Tax=Streptantibioticus silvisoli TaxID=2705255 RepID=A0AA90H432_9ACTN|nr:methyltransferase domain-containing protein [Streptantibioticus silvisoli]MDI5966260.1 methyltransferase domain-containing protein [Streptantibioticus silvisoli]MDI5971601.1 methyltransferase domain-containing protein [Streptantibioticus silvisoli]